jgi:hypothetical protein
MQSIEILGKNNEPDINAAQRVDDEIIRHRIRRLIEEPKPAPRWKGVLTHPFFLLFVGFMLTTLVGGLLTYYYSVEQAKLQSRRSFIDELNKTKIGKIADIWERVFIYEASVEETMRTFSLRAPADEGDSASQMDVVVATDTNPKESYQRSVALHKELIDTLNRHRFWLEEDDYLAIKEFANATYKYFLDLASGRNTREIKDKRDQARGRLSKVREKMLSE